MKIVTLKSVLWFCIIFLLALSFPIQVELFSPVPSLFPYVGIAFVLILTLVFNVKNQRKPLRLNTNTLMNLMVAIYLMLVFFHTGWQTLLGYSSPENAVSVIVIYVFPMFFLIYFTQVATDQEIRTVLKAMAWVGLAVGLYFAYDNYTKLVQGRVTDYAQRAMEYSLVRMNQTLETANLTRISEGSRGFGLLEKHTISAAWVSLGCFAALSLIPRIRIWRRMFIIATYGLLLLIGLNFTGIVGFALVIFLMEFRGIAWLRGGISKRSVTAIGIVIGVLMLLGVLLVWAIGWDMFEAIQQSLTGQVELAKGVTTLGEDEHKYLGGLIDDLADYTSKMSEFPAGFVIGDGFSTEFVVYEKGGDYGIVDTIYRFGLPFFLAIIFGLISLIRRSVRQMSLAGADQDTSSRYLWFAVCTTTYLLFSEIHYSIWNAKSILPVFFFTLALYARLLRPHQRKVVTSPHFIKEHYARSRA